MPATSRSQQRFFGMVHAAQHGKGGKMPPAVGRAAKTIDKTSVGHFAKTKHQGLPERRHKGHAKRAAALDPRFFKAAVDRAVRTQAADLAADVAGVFAVHDPRFVKVAQDVRFTGDLNRAIRDAFPTLSKHAHDRVFRLIVKGATNALRLKQANAGMAAGGAMSVGGGASASTAPTLEADDGTGGGTGAGMAGAGMDPMASVGGGAAMGGGMGGMDQLAQQAAGPMGQAAGTTGGTSAMPTTSPQSFNGAPGDAMSFMQGGGGQGF